MGGHKKIPTKDIKHRTESFQSRECLLHLEFPQIPNAWHFVSTQSNFDAWINELKPSGYRK